MSVEAGTSILERAALSGGIRPAVPEIGRTSAGESSALDRRGRDARAYDSGKLSRWRDGLARALAEHEQKQAETAPERAYIAAGRKARQVSSYSAPQSEQQETAATNGMHPNRRAVLAYERVSGAQLPVPLALGQGISLAV